MSGKFTFDEKKKLSERIQKLTIKKELQNVKNIIVENNPDLALMKNGNGFFMQFQNLSDNTYGELTKFLDKLDKKKQKEIESEILETSEFASEDGKNIDATSDLSDKPLPKKLRLTNTESHLLNKMKYEKELKKNDTNSDDMSFFDVNDKKTKIEEIFVSKPVKKNKK